MNQKDLIKYGLMAVAAYLIYKYVQEHGGIESLLGMGPSPLPATGTQIPAGGTSTLPINPNPPIAQGPVVPVLDMTGLSVHPDINDALTGIVRINGVPTTLSIITADGRIFNTAGQEVTASLQAQGVNIDTLRAGFRNAGGLSGMGAVATNFSAPWITTWMN